MNKKILLTLALIMLLNFAEATVSASVDRTSLQIGQSLTLTINTTNANGDPDLNSLKTNFEVYGTSTSSQMSIVNGQTSSQKALTVSLMPKNPGKQLIPAIKVGNDMTAPIQINVIPQSANDKHLENSQIFLEANINNKSTYVDVPVLYSIKLYYSVQLSNLSMAPLDIKNAQIKPLGKATQYQANLHGQTYQVVEQQFLITPSSAGEINIPPAQIRGSQLDNNGQSGNFFGMVASKPLSVKSKSLSLHVNAIPNNISISDWFPAKNVNIHEDWSVNTTSLKIGDPITRTITIEASGVPDTSIPDISIPAPKGLNAYPDKTISNNSVGNDTNLLSSKVFKIAYIPTESGSVIFPEVNVKWWDITSDSLKTVSIPAKNYTIINSGNKVAVPHIASTTSSKATLSVKTGNKWYYISIALAILWLISMFGGILLFKKRKQVSRVTKIDNKAITKAISEKNALANIYKACANRDLQALNLNLIEWAKCHFKHAIYTVSDISDIVDSPELRALINKLNLALYRGDVFDDFANLKQEIEKLIKTKDVNNNDNALKELYPK